MTKVTVHTQEEMAKVFRHRGAPDYFYSSLGNYTPHPTDSENDIFDEAMKDLCHGSKYVVLCYKSDLVLMPGTEGNWGEKHWENRGSEQ